MQPIDRQTSIQWQMWRWISRTQTQTAGTAVWNVKPAHHCVDSLPWRRCQKTSRYRRRNLRQVSSLFPAAGRCRQSWGRSTADMAHAGGRRCRRLNWFGTLPSSWWDNLLRPRLRLADRLLAGWSRKWYWLVAYHSRPLPAPPKTPVIRKKDISCRQMYLYYSIPISHFSIFFTTATMDRSYIFFRHVLTFVCLSVDRITEKVGEEFRWFCACVWHVWLETTD